MEKPNYYEQSPSMTDYSNLDSQRIEEKVPGRIMKQPGPMEGTFKRLAQTKKAQQTGSTSTYGSFSTLPSAVGATKDMKQSKLFQKFMQQ